MGLSHIDKMNGNADVFIAIGDDNYRGKGFGTKAMQYLIKYGFTTLKLHKINSGVFSENAPAINLYKKLGFGVEGILKDEVYFAGRYHDQILMSIFNTKY